MCGGADEYTLGTWLQRGYELYARSRICDFRLRNTTGAALSCTYVPHLGDIPLKKLTGRDCKGCTRTYGNTVEPQSFKEGKQPGLSDSTIRGIHTMLHNALDRAVEERLIVRNPADDCVPPKIRSTK